MAHGRATRLPLNQNNATQAKLVFAAPGAAKFTYDVMPFGPINGPTVFIILGHDVDSMWKVLATS